MPNKEALKQIEILKKLRKAEVERLILEVEVLDLHAQLRYEKNFNELSQEEKIIIAEGLLLNAEDFHNARQS